MNLALWILTALLALNAVVVILAVIAGKRGQLHAPPPGSPRARHLNGHGR